MLGVTTLSPSIEIIKTLHSSPFNGPIAEKRAEIISNLVQCLDKFYEVLASFRDTRHKGHKYSSVSEVDIDRFKIEAARSLVHFEVMVFPEVIDKLVLEDLTKIKEDRRLAYTMALMLMAHYRDKITHYSPGLEDSTKKALSFIGEFLKKLTAILSHSAFAGSKILKTAITEFYKAPGITSEIEAVEKAINSLHTLLESNGRLDTFTLIRNVLDIQYMHELKVYFVQVQRTGKSSAILPKDIIAFIKECPGASLETVLNRLSYQICQNPDLAGTYGIDADYLLKQILDAEKRSNPSIATIHTPSSALVPSTPSRSAAPRVGGLSSPTFHGSSLSFGSNLSSVFDRERVASEETNVPANHGAGSAEAASSSRSSLSEMSALVSRAGERPNLAEPATASATSSAERLILASTLSERTNSVESAVAPA